MSTKKLEDMMNNGHSNRVWHKYSQNQIECKGERYFFNEEWVFLYEHPVAGWLGGVRSSELDILRDGFAQWLREQLAGFLSGEMTRHDRLRATARYLYELLRQSPPPHNWLRLPADTRPGRNKSTIAYHSLLVSGFACAMVRAWTLKERPLGMLLRFLTDTGVVEEPELEEMVHFTRIGSLCHDFGKHPPQRHHERGKEQVEAIFSGLFERSVVADLAEIAYRHHTGPSYRRYDESPVGFLEELIAHADTLASAADRPASPDDPPDPVAVVAEFLRQRLGDERALSLISADTDKVKGYVFESAKLPEVRGASALLTQLNEEKIKQMLWRNFTLPPECLLYAAGGSALIIAPTELAPNIADRIQELYLEKTESATISVVWRPNTPKEWVKGVEVSEGNFGNLVKWLGYDLRRAKESRTFYPFFQVTPHVQRCDSCEVRPAVQPMIQFHAGKEQKFVCTVCAKKREFGNPQKLHYLKLFEDFLKKSHEHTDELKPIIDKHSDREKVEGGARTLEEIGSGAEGKAKGYVGVIYTDGNDIGSHLERSKTPADYRTLSEELLRVTKEATFKGLARQVFPTKIKCSDGQERLIYPFEIVAIGGDDVFLIVPGDVALDIALKLCKEFEEQFDHRLTMSAGVLIMREHFPIYYAREIVDMLLKSAKRAGCRDKSEKGLKCVPAYIDFQVITGDTSLSEDLERYREQVYSTSLPFQQNYRLIQRPYSLDGLQRLLKVVRWAKREGFPTSQLYQLRQAVIEHVPAWAKNWYHYQLARSEEVDNKWRKLHCQLFPAKPIDDEDLPWLGEDNRWTTPIVDLVEIFDYVRQDGGGEVSAIED